MTRTSRRPQRQIWLPVVVDTTHSVSADVDLLEDTLPPTPLRDLAAAADVAIYVLSADPAFVRSVDRASGHEYPIEAVTEWFELVEAMERGLPHIVLLDVDAVPMRFDKAVATLHRVAPALVVVAVARREAAASPMRLLAQRKIHRLLMKPAAEGLTRLLLESALDRYVALHAEGEPTRPARQTRLPRASGPLWLLAMLLVALAAGAVIIGELYGVF